MPLVPNAHIPCPQRPTPPDVLDPLAYRFGGYVFNMDLQHDDIILKFRTVTQPQIWSRMSTTRAQVRLVNG